MSQRHQWMVVGGSAVLFALLIGVGLTRLPPATTVGGPAPDFDARHLASGERVSLATYRGQVILLNIWATWCAPCEAEMPSLQRLYDELSPGGLRILAVSVDETSPDGVLAWTAARRLTFDILHDPSRTIEARYQTIGVPESFVIDRDGRIVKRVTGFAPERDAWDRPESQALFRRLLRQRSGD